MPESFPQTFLSDNDDAYCRHLSLLPVRNSVQLLTTIFSIFMIFLATNDFMFLMQLVLAEHSNCLIACHISGVHFLGLASMLHCW